MAAAKHGGVMKKKITLEMQCKTLLGISSEASKIVVFA